MVWPQYVDGASWVALHDRDRLISEIEGAALRHAEQVGRNGRSHHKPFYQYVLGQTNGATVFGVHDALSSHGSTGCPYADGRNAYGAMGGMDEVKSEATVTMTRPDESIADAIERRTSSDPLSGIVPRSTRPQSEYSRVMSCIDDVAQEVRIPYHDYNDKDAFFVRICALVKILHGLLHADGINQSVMEECFAVCILERVARMHPDGVYIWRQTAWEKQDTQHPTTHGMKAEWKRCIDAVAGFFFSISGQDVARQWGDLSDELKLQRARAKAAGSDAVARWEGRRRTSLSEKER